MVEAALVKWIENDLTYKAPFEWALGERQGGRMVSEPERGESFKVSIGWIEQKNKRKRRLCLKKGTGRLLRLMQHQKQL